MTRGVNSTIVIIAVAVYGRPRRLPIDPGLAHYRSELLICRKKKLPLGTSYIPLDIRCFSIANPVSKRETHLSSRRAGTVNLNVTRPK